MAEYIERDALWTDIMMLPHNGDIISSEDVEQAIKAAPASDVVEVRHGRWITGSDNQCCCSECKTLGSPRWKGCPVCLARMDDE